MTEPVESPCVSICHMNIRLGICVGCFRTIDEIAHWSEMTNEERLEVLSKLDDRAFEV